MEEKPQTEKTVEEKQAFLRSEILDQGYDGQEFMDFFEKQNLSSSNLESISFSQIEAIINEFKSQQQFQPSENQEPEISSSNNNQQSSNDQQQPQKKPSQMELSSIFSSVITTLKPKYHNGSLEKPFTKHNVITILDPTTKRNYLLYEWQYKVYYSPKDSMIVRNYSDFTWLRKFLIQNYPGLYIPPLPISSFDSGDSEKVLKNLEIFMNAIVNRTIFSKSKIIEDFVLLNEKDFHEKKKFYSQLKEFYQINSETTEMFTKELEPNEKKKGKNVEKLSNDISLKEDALDELIYAIQKVSNEMNVMENLFKNLSAAYKKVCECYSDNKDFCKYFHNLKKLSDEWSKGYSNQKIFFTEEMELFYTYMKNEYKEYHYTIDKYNGARKNFKNIEGDTTNKEEYKKVKSISDFYSLIVFNEYQNLESRQLKTLLLQKNDWYIQRVSFIQDYKRFMELLS